MNLSLQRIATSLTGVWRKLDRRQKILTVAIPAVVLGLLLFLVWWASSPDYTPLFQGPLTASDAGDVTSKLKDLKIPYQLNDGGTTILVPKAQVAEVRIQLASAGIPKTGKFSFGTSLNTLQFGETDADRKLRVTLGLQDELETTLKTLSAVQDARVHLVMPDQSLFADQQKDPTAAVTVKLQPGSKLSDEQVRAIANLLASSVEGLKPEKVTIIDTDGQVLSDAISNPNDKSKLSVSQLQLQHTVEQDLERSAQSMLDRALGPGKSIVRVAGTLDFNQVETTKETYGPNVIRSQQASEETSTNGAGASGVPSDPNIPGYATTTGSGVVVSKKTQTEQNYEVDKTQEHSITSPGSVQRLSVSVLLDAPTADKNTVQTVKDIVTSAVGLNTQRGDQIEVAAIPFNNKSLQADQQAMADKAKRDMYTRYALAGAAGLIVLVLGVMLLAKNARRARAAALNRSLGAAQVAAAHDREVDSANVPEQQLKQNDLKQQAEQALAKRPEEVAGVIKVWLQEER